MCKVSIIVPLYNKANYVYKALDSIVNQTYKDWECIIIDDGSTDGSAFVVEQFTSRLSPNDERICLIHQANTGVAAVRNHGISLSYGEYLAFLDADDWWAPTYLEEMLAFIEQYPQAGIWGCNYYKVRHKQTSIVLDIPTGYFDYFQAYKDVRMPLWTGAVITKKSIVMSGSIIGSNHEIFPEHIHQGEDFDLWIRLALQYKTAFLNKPLSYYNNDVSAILKESRKLHDSQYHIGWNLDQYEPELWENRRRKEISNEEQKRLIDMLRLYAWQPYYVSHQYHQQVKDKLHVINWELQPQALKQFYRTPIRVLVLRNRMLSLCSQCIAIFKKYR